MGEPEAPNGYRLLQIGDVIPCGTVQRRRKAAWSDWHKYEWPVTNHRVESDYSNYYAVKDSNPTEREW